MARPIGPTPRRLYVARLLVSGAYKIGITRDLRDRTAQLAQMYREPVAMLASRPGTIFDERAALARFKPLRTAHRNGAPNARELFDDRDGEIARWALTLDPQGHIAFPAAPKFSAHVKAYRAMQRRARSAAPAPTCTARAA